MAMKKVEKLKKKDIQQLLLRNYIKHFKLPALQQAVSYKHLHNQVELCGLEKRTSDTVVQSAVLVAVCRNAAKKRQNHPNGWTYLE